MQHNHWSGKNCPEYIRKGKAPNGTVCWNWEQLNAAIAKERAALDGTGKPTISDVLKEALSKPTPTGHTIHPFFHAVWSLETDGYPVLPAIGYTDGKIRQVFDNSLLEANADGSSVRRGGLGQAFVRLSGGNHPDWDQIHPQVA